MNYYCAYGLRFASEIPLPEFTPCAPDDVDVRILCGGVAESLPGGVSSDFTWERAGAMQLCKVAGLARYLLTGDDEIRVSPEEGARPEDVRNVLLGSVLAALFYTRRLPVFHASAVEAGGGAVLFTGQSGLGKSTLMAALLQRGYPMLTDDKAVLIRRADGIVEVRPGYPAVRLTAAATEKLGFPVGGEELQPGPSKYMLRVERFCSTPQPIRAVYHLSAHGNGDIRIDGVSGAQSTALLAANLYRPRNIRLAQQRAAVFHALTAISARARVARVQRPEHPYLLDELAGSIERDLAAHPLQG